MAEGRALLVSIGAMASSCRAECLTVGILRQQRVSLTQGASSVMVFSSSLGRVLFRRYFYRSMKARQASPRQFGGAFTGTVAGGSISGSFSLTI